MFKIFFKNKFFVLIVLILLISISGYSLNKIKEFRVQINKEKKIQYDRNLMNFTSENLLINRVFNKGNIFILRHTKKHDLGIEAAHLHKESLFNLLPGLDKKIACLSDIGKIEAQIIGMIFDELNININEIHSSSMCRAIETAKIAFGEIDQIHDFLIYNSYFKDSDFKNKSEELNNFFFNNLIDNKKNYLLSTHSGVMKRVNLDFNLNEGGILVYNIELQKPILFLKDYKSVIKFYEYYQK